MKGLLNSVTKTAALSVPFMLTAAASWAQSVSPAPPPPVQTGGTTPLYRVTVVDRTVKAINYQYRSGPTMIDFRGTVLLPYAKGEAIVESRQGRVDIDAKIEGLVPAQRFGREYLTYVLWAITPEGRPHNIGELVSDTSNKAKLHVTTDLQAFALIVTAEPYSAVRMPSDVVVAENQVRPDTLGTIEQVNAKFELLPRGDYTLQVQNGPVPDINGPKLSMHQYEAATEVYQAQNALAIAANIGAERYAPDVYARAQQLLTTAQQIRDRKGDYRQVVQIAREASQTAEDARVIAAQHQDIDRLNAANAELARTRAELASARREQQDALQQARDAEAAAAASRAEAQATVARERADAEVSATPARAAQAQAIAAANAASQVTPQRSAENRQEAEMSRQREMRGRILNEMRGTFPTLDSGRGLVATVPDDGFRGATIVDSASSRVMSLGRVLARYPGLVIHVEGYSGAADGEVLSLDRADAVRRALIAGGVPLTAITAQGLGNTRPIGPNATVQQRRDNTRVEIVISGDLIGLRPLWEHSGLSGALSPRESQVGRSE